MSDDKPESVCAKLIAEMQSLQLSTVGEDGVPHCGYTPYLHRTPCSFYIFVSQLAVHTQDLLSKGTVAIMIIADEQSTSQIFARTRVHYQCQTQLLAPEHPEYPSILDDYQARHGKTAVLLRQLPDFVLFHLQPLHGQFVMGFGKAYTLTGNNLSIFEPAQRG